MNPAISEAEYHKLPGVRSSLLKDICKHSPAMARYHAKHHKSAPHLSVGTVVNDVLLRGKSVGEMTMTLSKYEGKGAKARRAEEVAQAEAEGKIPMSESDIMTVQQCLASVMNHEMGRRLLSKMPEMHEKTLQWHDFQFDLDCKARLDAGPDGYLVDLKTTSKGATAHEFNRAVCDYMYDLQACHYSRGAEALGMGPREFVFVVIETTPPYSTAVWILPERWVAVGRQRWEYAMNKWRICLESDVYPGIVQEKQADLMLPPPPPYIENVWNGEERPPV